MAVDTTNLSVSTEPNEPKINKSWKLGHSDLKILSFNAEFDDNIPIYVLKTKAKTNAIKYRWYDCNKSIIIS